MQGRRERPYETYGRGSVPPSAAGRHNCSLCESFLGSLGVWLPDVRRRRRDRHEAEALEDGPAVVQGIDLEIAIAPELGEACPVRDQGAVDPAATPRRE